jgi:DUF4097 and DUF4098 domain-containing protein YvlB
VSGGVGSIHVRVGVSGRIVVAPTVEAKLFSGNSTTTYTLQDPQHLNIVVSAPAYNILGSNIVDFDIIVPEEVDLQLRSSIGDIVVTGVHGQLIASSGVGTVKVEQVLLTNSGSIQTTSGSITFDGSIASHARYHLESNVGSLYVTLPIQSSLHLDAETVTGAIHTIRSGIQVSGSLVGGKAHGDMGGNTFLAMLSLKTTTGSITIQ